MIGKIKRVTLREVWKHEALDFTTWLEENIDVVSDIIDIELSNAEREASAGKFSVDLVAEDSRGNLVIIENQLEKSNHDHLGKVITYLTTLEAKIAIWIVADPRPEHIRAISWLNESSSASFYLLKIEAVQIADSAPAPLLTLIVGPSEEGRDIGEKKKELSERYTIRNNWWTQFLNHAKTKTKLHANISPNDYNWIGTSSGIRGLNFNYAVRKADSTIELYIDRGKESDEENKQIYDQLISDKDEIEQIYGGSLDWDPIEGKRAYKISTKITGGYRDSEEKWGEIHDNKVNTMIKFSDALKPYIKKINI